MPKKASADASKLSYLGEPRGFAARSRVLARLASLAQIGELARRLLSSAPRGFAARSRVLVGLASPAQIGELARRLSTA